MSDLYYWLLVLLCSVRNHSNLIIRSLEKFFEREIVVSNRSRKRPRPLSQHLNKSTHFLIKLIHSISTDGSLTCIYAILF